MKTWVAKGIASDVNDFTTEPIQPIYLLLEGKYDDGICKMLLEIIWLYYNNMNLCKKTKNYTRKKLWCIQIFKWHFKTILSTLFEANQACIEHRKKS